MPLRNSTDNLETVSEEARREYWAFCHDHQSSSQTGPTKGQIPARGLHPSKLQHLQHFLDPINGAGQMLQSTFKRWECSGMSRTCCRTWWKALESM
ncbi:hypothetical protein GDO78_014054 [Eleutherodactylus coqui]|uniref:Uncharacterized protein n=1 Tax=Eleutherodactylus coqui TaxID=57060 RepID=A0A8J6E915_ELECQ|nr:hypothetical protein GDO78_014054 [Eleutherodactylus coqui]